MCVHPRVNSYCCFFFFQAEDGIRDVAVTGVQTCALPILAASLSARAGRPLEPVNAADNDAAIQAIEKQLHCTCGCNLDVYTCRTTDFTCTVSPAMHQHVVGLAERGMTGQQIIDQFVREHGVAILMAPPKRGFNLAGYFVPSVLIVAAGLVLTLVLRRWARTAAPDRVPARPLAPPGTTEELERLRGALDRPSG